jgi:hypothetical protein
MREIANLGGIRIIALAVVLVFALSACGEPGGGEGGGNPELPSALRYTNWVHTDGDWVRFGTNTVSVNQRGSMIVDTFTLKSSVTVPEINQTTLFFGNNQTSNFIVYRDGTISSVGLGGVEKTNGWSRDNRNPVTPELIDRITSNLRAQSGGNSTSNPVTLSINSQLIANLQLTEANWNSILTAISTVYKYVALDLSLCTRSSASSGGGLRSDGTFDSTSSASGDGYITSLILPNTATSIASNGDYGNFYHFSNLDSVSASAVTRIDDNTFRNSTSLTSVSFPLVTSIGDCAFSGCTNLSDISFPKVITIGDEYTGPGAFYGCSSFYGCNSLISVSLPQATTIGSYAFSGCNSLISVSLPQATTIESDAFSGCNNLISVSLPQATTIESGAFANTGTTALTISLGQTAPTLGYQIFSSISSAKTVTVKVPVGATGYGNISATYSGNNEDENWGTGFRGRGWTGTGFESGERSHINSYITLHIQYQ